MSEALKIPPKAIAIIGPTASGKTRLALELGQTLPIEIISMDSALVYRDMDIGTAKPTEDERKEIPHHLIDIISPMATYSAANFVNDTLALSREIQTRGKIAVIVGGTMMYFNALKNGLNSLPEANAKTRENIQKIKKAEGLEALYQQLKAIDPITAAQLKPADTQRIERALEVYDLTGTPMSELLKETTTPPAIDILPFVLMPEPRASLHQLIEHRFHLMLESNFVDEVTLLRQNYPDLTADHPSMRSVGYRQAWSYLDGDIDYNDFVAQGIAATRQLAKRQITWLRKWALPNQYNLLEDKQALNDISQKIHSFLN